MPRYRFAHAVLIMGLYGSNLVPHGDDMAYAGLYSIGALTGGFVTKAIIESGDPDEGFANSPLKAGFRSGSGIIAGLGAAWYSFKLSEQLLSRYSRPEEWVHADTIYDVTEINIEFGSYKFNHPEKLGYNYQLIKNKRFLQEGTTPIRVCARLLLPNCPVGIKVPAMIVVHHSKGLSHDIQSHAMWLSSQGVAVLVIDNFGNILGKGRDLVRVGSDQFQLAAEEQLLDLFLGRQVLSNYADHIDLNRVGICGMSRGAEIVAMAQRTYVFSNLDDHQKPFDLAYAYYAPTLSHPFDLRDGVANKPFCAFVGLADDYAPADATIAYLKALQEAGHEESTVQVYKGGFHGFDHPQYFRDRVPWYADIALPLINLCYKKSRRFRTFLNKLVDVKVNLPGNAYFTCDSEGFMPLDDLHDNGTGKHLYGHELSQIDVLEQHIREHMVICSVYAAYDLGVHLNILKDTQTFLKDHGFLE